MKKYLLLLIPALFCYCSTLNQDRETIRSIVLNHISEETDLNIAIEQYTTSYYRLPNSFEQIISFLEEWKRQAPDSYLFDSFYALPGKTYVESLKGEVYNCAFYEDSLFIFHPRNKVGTAVYGHPKYWIEHPEKYPPERMDYFSNFPPAFYDINGRYLFNIDGDEFQKRIKVIGESFNCIVMSEKQTRPYLRIKASKTLPEMVIFEYEKEKDRLILKTPIPQRIALLNTITKKTTITEECDFSAYFAELLNCIRSFVVSNHEIYNVVFTTYLYH